MEYRTTGVALVPSTSAIVLSAGPAGARAKPSNSGAAVKARWREAGQCGTGHPFCVSTHSVCPITSFDATWTLPNGNKDVVAADARIAPYRSPRCRTRPADATYPPSGHTTLVASVAWIVTAGGQTGSDTISWIGAERCPVVSGGPSRTSPSR
ncbi:MAG: hypothetical protein ACREP9_05060 [Candidatus Dormibacteraceae bacterium]